MGRSFNLRPQVPEERVLQQLAATGAESVPLKHSFVPMGKEGKYMGELQRYELSRYKICTAALRT